MIPQKKQPVILFFAIIYIVFGGSLVYLLFLNTGLDIVMETGEKEVKVFLKNDSVHLIRDINISIQRQSGEILALPSVDQLKPGEKKEITLPELENEQIKIIAAAPFHAKVSKVVSIEKSRGAKINFEVITQSTAFTGVPFLASIRICNEAEQIDDLKVDEMHSTGFFEERARTETVSLPKGECKKLDFTLTPKMAGAATIYFKLSAANVSRELEQKITIVER